MSCKPASIKVESADDVKGNDDLPKIVKGVADDVDLSDSVNDMELDNDSVNDVKVNVDTNVNVGSVDDVEVIVDDTKVSDFMP